MCKRNKLAKEGKQLKRRPGATCAGLKYAKMWDVPILTQGIWLTALTKLWWSSMELPSQCPCPDLTTSAVCIFISCPILDYPFHYACTLLPPSISSQINNSPLIIFSSLIPDLLHLYSNSICIGNLSLTWYYWYGYLGTVVRKMPPLHPFNYLENSTISYTTPPPSQDPAILHCAIWNFCQLLTLSYPAISHVTSHSLSMSWSVSFTLGQGLVHSLHLPAAPTFLHAKSSHRSFFELQNCFSSS